MESQQLPKSWMHLQNHSMLLVLIDRRFSWNRNLYSQQSNLTTPILPALPMFGQNYSFTESMTFQIYWCLRTLFCISASNSTVQKVFSTLTKLLLDCCLTMKHSTIEDYIVIVVGNSSVWSEWEKDEILDGAVDLCESSEESLSTDSDAEIIVNLRKTSHQFQTYLVFIQFL